jgi:hypothetical protein
MPTQEKLILEQRTVYGRELVYPVCATSQTLVLLTGRKTFNVEDMDTLREAGFKIDLKHT